MYLSINFRWKSLRSVSLMNEPFSLSSSPREQFLNTTSSFHLLFTLNSLLLFSGLPCRMFSIRIFSSFALCSASRLASSAARSFFSLFSSASRSAVSSSLPSSSSLSLFGRLFFSSSSSSDKYTGSSASMSSDMWSDFAFFVDGKASFSLSPDVIARFDELLWRCALFSPLSSYAIRSFSSSSRL